MEYKYGEFSQNQIARTKKRMRKKIFFLLLYVDPVTSKEYESVDVDKAFENVLSFIAGMNELLHNPQEIVSVMSYLEAARMEYQSNNFNWQRYRKLILDAGNLVLEIKEV